MDGLNPEGVCADVMAINAWKVVSRIVEVSILGMRPNELGMGVIDRKEYLTENCDIYGVS